MSRKTPPTKMLIVESAAKARTIQRYLGDGWVVMATGGHVQDLPSGREHGKAGRKATFAEGPDGLPRAPWVWTERGEQAVGKIIERAERDGVGEIYLASDPDREGELIAWRLQELLADVAKTHRVTFHEVTPEAIREALSQTRPIDMALVRSALVRKFLDRLVGFRTSKVARAYLAGGGKASMGRVQTPTLGFVVERELEREAHVPIPFFEVRAVAAAIELGVRFYDTRDSAAWRDDAGKVNPRRTADAALAKRAHDTLAAGDEVTIVAAKQGSSTRKPKPALSTDALLQAAGSRWGWSPSRTMRVATALYEAGHISYIRTDSTRLAPAFVAEARALIEGTWGADHLGAGVAPAKATGKIQDAHEAVRPTRVGVAAPEGLDGPARQLYALVRAHALASQMSPARFLRVSLTCRAEGLDLPLVGSVSWRVHAGWQAAFASLDKPPAEAPPAVKLAAGEGLALDPSSPEAPNPRLIEDATKPPARYRPHTLVRAMKEHGIGRPSTYASTVQTLEDRRYLSEEGGALVPTERGRAVWLEVAPLYDHEADGALFGVEFTAEMESHLDRVEDGRAQAREVWARYRDSVRALHEAARGHMNSGLATPKRIKQLSALLAAAPPGFEAPAELTTLSQREALALITELRGLGVQPPPSEAQRGYIERMMNTLGLAGDEVAALIGLPNLDALATSEQASALIERLRVKLDEERPASPKQLALIRGLIGKLGLDEGRAAALVGAAGLGALTGGRSGTASALIDALRAQQRAAKAAKAAGAPVTSPSPGGDEPA